jgi:hypothetical protein
MTLFDGKTPSEKIPEKIKRKKTKTSLRFKFKLYDFANGVGCNKKGVI